MGSGALITTTKLGGMGSGALITTTELGVMGSGALSKERFLEAVKGGEVRWIHTCT